MAEKIYKERLISLLICRYKQVIHMEDQKVAVQWFAERGQQLPVIGSAADK